MDRSDILAQIIHHQQELKRLYAEWHALEERRKLEEPGLVTKYARTCIKSKGVSALSIDVRKQLGLL